MEEEEDDFYGTNGASTETAQASGYPAATQNGVDDVKDERMNEELEEGEEEEEEGSDSEVEIVLDSKEPVVEPTPQPRFNAVKIEPPRTTPSEQPSRPSQPTPIKTESTSRAQPPQRSGASYPEVHTSTVDVNANPIYEPVGKPITEVDIDTDLAEHDKPWRRPGADQSDYFNYDFDEFTWATYCLKQKTMAATLAEQKAESAKFEMMFGGGGAGMPPLPGGMPGVPTGPANAGAVGGGGVGGGAGLGAGVGAGVGGGGIAAGGAAAGMPPMPGFPPGDEMMQQMMAQMMAQGITDPSQLDFGTFMQGMQQMQGAGGVGSQGGGGGVPQGPAAQQQGQQGGWGGYGGGGGGGRGRGGGRRW